jgi:hypothetical protein
MVLSLAFVVFVSLVCCSWKSPGVLQKCQQKFRKFNEAIQLPITVNREVQNLSSILNNNTHWISIESHDYKIAKYRCHSITDLASLFQHVTSFNAQYHRPAGASQRRSELCKIVSTVVSIAAGARAGHYLSPQHHQHQIREWASGRRRSGSHAHIAGLRVAVYQSVAMESSIMPLLSIEFASGREFSLEHLLLWRVEEVQSAEAAITPLSANYRGGALQLPCLTSLDSHLAGLQSILWVESVSALGVPRGEHCGEPLSAPHHRRPVAPQRGCGLWMTVSCAVVSNITTVSSHYASISRQSAMQRGSFGAEHGGVVEVVAHPGQDQPSPPYQQSADRGCVSWRWVRVARNRAAEKVTQEERKPAVGISQGVMGEDLTVPPHQQHIVTEKAAQEERIPAVDVSSGVLGEDLTVRSQQNVIITRGEHNQFARVLYQSSGDGPVVHIISAESVFEHQFTSLSSHEVSAAQQIAPQSECRGDRRLHGTTVVAAPASLQQPSPQAWERGLRVWCVGASGPDKSIRSALLAVTARAEPVMCRLVLIKESDVAACSRWSGSRRHRSIPRRRGGAVRSSGAMPTLKWDTDGGVVSVFLAETDIRTNGSWLRFGYIWHRSSIVTILCNVPHNQEVI